MTENPPTTVVKVTNPEKIGDGLSAFVRYTMITETIDPLFSAERFEVHRRFSEFHALYEHIVDVYRDKGIHIPHPPPKSVISTAKVKGMNVDPNEDTVIEMRRSSLETFINRFIRDPVLLKDKIIMDFLSSPVATARARDNLIKLRSNVASTFSSLVPDVDTCDKWFEEKTTSIHALEQNLQKLYQVALDVRTCRKDLYLTTKKFSNTMDELRSSEPNQSLESAFVCIVEVKQNICNLYEQQCLNDLHHLVGTISDCLDDLISVKHLLSLYTKKFADVKKQTQNLEKLREKSNQMQVAGKTQTELQAIDYQVTEAERHQAFSDKNLQEFYEQMKKSLEFFDENRFIDMKKSVISYLVKWKEIQEQILREWEGALPVFTEIKEVS